MKFLVDKVEEFFDRYRPHSDPSYFGPPKIRASDSTVIRINAIIKQLLTMSDQEIDVELLEIKSKIKKLKKFLKETVFLLVMRK